MWKYEVINTRFKVHYHFFDYFVFFCDKARPFGAAELQFPVFHFVALPTGANFKDVAHNKVINVLA